MSQPRTTEAPAEQARSEAAPETQEAAPGSPDTQEVAPETPDTQDAGDAPLRIHEVADLVGLTPRSIRYYEEMGLLSPSARSQGAYRLFDQLDVERLRFIKGLRDDAGFSIAEIRSLLEDEAARRLAREALAATDDPAERRRILQGRIDSLDGQLASLRSKRARLDEMIESIERRRAHTLSHLADLDAVPGGAAEPAVAVRGSRR